MGSEETQNSLKVHFVSSTSSPEFSRLTRALTRASVIGLDAEWKPGQQSQLSTFPTVSLLQLACRVNHGLGDLAEADDSPVFLLDLLSVPLPSIWEILKDVFTSPDILKLGFRFKQDLKYLSSTFQAQGCVPGFDRVSNSTVLKLAPFDTIEMRSEPNLHWNNNKIQLDPQKTLSFGFLSDKQ